MASTSPPTQKSPLRGVRSRSRPPTFLKNAHVSPVKPTLAPTTTAMESMMIAMEKSMNTTLQVAAASAPVRPSLLVSPDKRLSVFHLKQALPSTPLATIKTMTATALSMKSGVLPPAVEAFVEIRMCASKASPLSAPLFRLKKKVTNTAVTVETTTATSPSMKDLTTTKTALVVNPIRKTVIERALILRIDAPVTMGFNGTVMTEMHRSDRALRKSATTRTTTVTPR